MISKPLAFLLAGGAALLFGCSSVSPDQAIQVATGMISHTLCSEVFVSRLDADRAYAEGLQPRGGLGLINWAVRYDIDTARRQVSTTVAGRFLSRASVCST